jgi:hypothetical protein
MIQLNLTPQETIMLYGLLEGTLEKLRSTDLPLNNQQNAIDIVGSVMVKIAEQLEHQENNN